MNLRYKTYATEAYQHLLRLEQEDPLKVIRFYENNTSDLKKLDFDKYFDVLYLYSEALFTAGQFQKFTICAKELLQIIIEQNIYTYREVNIYNYLLYRLGTAYYHLYKIEDAKHIFRCLCKLDNNEIYRDWLYKCYKQERPDIAHHLQGFAIGFILLSVISIGIHLLVIQPFLESYENVMEAMMISLFILSTLSWTGAEVYIIWHARKRTSEAHRG